MEAQIPPRYTAQDVEARWYARWEEAGLFQPCGDGRPRFTITIPPPNITGSLHMGHALCYPVQDLIGRYRRLRGDDVLILPGQDHAGIATQSVVAKRLKQQKIDPVALGREGFVERVWEWRKESGDTILRQFRRLGCAFDWTRERFTMDEHYVRAVLGVFVQWFDAGLIYRGKRVVNWDPALDTSVSDIETERKTTRGKLYHVRYPFEGESGHLVVATTRPETMLGDVAVAVHPSDARYKHLVGKTLVLPIVGRPIPLIADPYPDPEFGTGAVKVTPAHDPNDYEVGVRHDLPMPVVITGKGRMTEDTGRFAGLDRFEVRKLIVQELEEAGLLERIEDHDIPLIISERSGDVVEPLLAEQWFVRQTELAKPAIEAVRDGRVRFFPERYDRIFLDWMEGIRDWNISRKLWWGHRIPVYYTEDGEPVAALSWEEAEAKAGRAIARQDDEVLDTWLSSGLWPFATLGWPDDTADLRERYPTSVLVTDRNIINLWVARMVMMGLHFTGKAPFHHVVIHATVMTEQGRRMSKSLGTGVDPMDVIEKIGADALRFTLLSQAGTAQEIRYSEKKTESARNFCNKIWNASRYVLMSLEGYERGRTPETGELELVDRWLLSRLAATEETVRAAYDGYDFQAAAQALETFFWSDYCDWYIEVSKQRLADASNRHVPQAVLLSTLHAFLVMLHPIMPFITEEVASALPLDEAAGFVMSSSWPESVAAHRDEVAEHTVQRWFDVTRALRALRAEVGLNPMRQIPLAYYEGDLGEGAALVASQAWVEALRIGRPSDACISDTVAGVDLHLPIEGLVDRERESARLAKEEADTEAKLAALRRRLDDPEFVQRAKPDVVERDREAADELEAKLGKVRERQRLFGG